MAVPTKGISPNPNTAAAKALMAERVLCRRRFLPYVQKFEPAYRAGWVHELIARKLEAFSQAVTEQKSPRLMLLMPPRHGKSRLASVRFPSWHLGRNPDHEYISASYNVALPTAFSRTIRELLRSTEHRGIFADCELHPESQSAEQWNTTLSGGYTAAGVGGGITGKGAHVLGIDDPIKNAEEADSQTIREALWDWYGSTAYTRLAPGGGVLIIQTWWHYDDLAGRILEKMAEDPEFDQFEVIRFPAVAEEEEWLTPGDTIWRPSDGVAMPEGSTLLRVAGDPLHAERYDAAALARIQKTLTPRHWSALYQQNPTPDDGLYFTKDMFNDGLVAPKGSHVYAAWDFAISKKTSADYTVGAVGGLDYNDDLTVMDVIRGKMDSFAIIEVMLDQYEKYRPLVVGVEGGQIWRALEPIFNKRCAERRLYPVIQEFQPLTDKEARARPLQGRMRQGKVKFPPEAPWLPALKREFLRFPGGVNDDQVDALAWLGHLVVNAQAPRRPVHSSVRPQKSWRDKLKNYVSDSRGSAMAA